MGLKQAEIAIFEGFWVNPGTSGSDSGCVGTRVATVGVSRLR